MLLHNWKPSVQTRDWHFYGLHTGQTCLYFFESKHVQQLISKGFPHAYKFHGASMFIDDICIIDDNGEFSSSCKYIYLTQAIRTKT